MASGLSDSRICWNEGRFTGSCAQHRWMMSACSPESRSDSGGLQYGGEACSGSQTHGYQTLASRVVLRTACHPEWP